MLTAALAIGGAGMHVATASEPQAAALIPMVEFQRTGGLAGVEDRIVVQPDGRTSRDTSGAHCIGQLTPQEVATLRADLNRANISSIPSAEAPPAADVFAYTVTHAGTTVRTYDTVVPERLQPVVKQLTALATRPC